MLALLIEHLYESELQVSFSLSLSVRRLTLLGVEHQGKIYLDLSRSYEPPDASTDDHATHEPVPIKIVIRIGSEKGILFVEALHERSVVGTAKIDYGKTNARRAVRSAGVP